MRGKGQAETRGDQTGMTDVAEVEQALSGLNAKSLAGKLRSMMPAIIEQSESGVSQTDIVAALNAAGVDIHITTLRTYIYRYRKKHAGAKRRRGDQPVVNEPREAQKSAGASVGIPEPQQAVEVEPAVVVAAEDGPAFDTRRLKSVGDKYTTKAPALFGAAKRGN